jgi:hypothetical protein
MERSMNIQGIGCAQLAGTGVHGGLRSFSVRMLVAYTARRKHLTTRVKAENPSYTESEIEARLEQFGA